MSITKNCNYCFQEKDIALFSKGRKCKDCERIYQAAYKEDIKNGIKRIRVSKSSLPEILCLKCKVVKDSSLFRKGKLICKDCNIKYTEEYNQRKKEDYAAGIFSDKLLRKCKICNQEKSLDNFYLTGYRCHDCKNNKPDRLAEKHKLKLQEWEKAANEPKRCIKCSETKLKSDFRFKRNICKKCYSISIKQLKLLKNPPLPPQEKELKLNSKGEMEQVKCCIRCNKIKFNSEFVVRRGELTKNFCKECQNSRGRDKYYSKRKRFGYEVLPKYKKARFTQLQKRQRAAECRRRIYARDRDKILVKNREYKKNNRAKFNKYNMERYYNDLSFNVETKLRRRVRVGIANGGGRKTNKTVELLGCSFEEAKEHICSQFQDGMTWEGIISGDIEIDHIIPCAFFDLTNPEEQKECFNYKNLRPLWKKENNSKLDYYFGICWRYVPKAIKNINKLTAIAEELNNIN